MRKHINNFKNFQINEVYIQGPGGVLDDNSTVKDKFIYKIKELSWLKDRFELNIDGLTDEYVNEYLNELTKSVNSIHLILNKIR